MSQHSIHLKGMELPVFQHPRWDRFPLYGHQYASLEQQEPFLMTVPTGLGKTFAGLIPSIIERRHKTFFVFPSNALVETQYTSVRQRLRDWGVDMHVLKLTGDVLLEAMLEGGHKTKGEALYNLLTEHERNVIFTNIDIMFNIVAMRYSARYKHDLVRMLKNARIIFDEFHFYKNVTAVLLGALFRLILDFTNAIAFLSATPAHRIVELLEIIQGKPLTHISLNTPLDVGIVRRTSALHPVHLEVSMNSSDSLREGASWLAQRARANKLGMAIVRSVRDAIWLYKNLTNQGITVCLYTGPIKEPIGNVRDIKIIVGTSAIEVGVDLPIDFLFFEATNLTSFLQRFGRVGRHTSGEAFAVVPQDLYNQLAAFPSDKPMERSTVLDKLGMNEYRFDYQRLYLSSPFSEIIHSLIRLYDPDIHLSNDEYDLLRLLHIRDSVTCFVLGNWKGREKLVLYDVLRAVRDYRVKRWFYGDEVTVRLASLDQTTREMFVYYSQFVLPVVLEIEDFAVSEDKLYIRFQEPSFFQPSLPYVKACFSPLLDRELLVKATSSRIIWEEGCITLPDWSDKQKVWVWGFSSKFFKENRSGVII